MRGCAIMVQRTACGIRKGQLVEEQIRLAKGFVKSIDPVFYGLALPYVWFSMLMSQKVGTPNGDVANPQLLFDVGLCVVYVVLLLGSRTTLSRRFLPRACTAGSVLCTLATIIHVASFIVGASPLAQALVCVLGGLGFSLMTLVWKSLFCAFGPAQVTVLFCGSKLVSDVLIIALEGYVPGYYLAAFVVICVLGIVFTWRAVRLAAKAVPADDSLRFRRLVKITALCVVYGVAYGYSSNLSVGVTVVTLSDLGFCVLVLAAFLLLQQFDVVVLYRSALPMLIVALLLFPAFSFLPTELTQVAVRISYTAIIIYIAVAVCSLCRKQGTSPIKPFCITSLAVHLSIQLGRGLSALVQSLQDGFANEGALVAILVIGAVAVSWLTLHEQPLFIGACAAKEGSLKDELVNRSNAATVEAWRDKYSLTARERELLGALVEGASVEEIASDLFISQGTVKAHIQHIYRKVGVHSREELMNRFGAERS